MLCHMLSTVSVLLDSQTITVLFWSTATTQLPGGEPMPATPAAVQVSNKGKSHKVPLGKVGSCMGQPSEVLCLRIHKFFQMFFSAKVRRAPEAVSRGASHPKSSRLAVLLYRFTGDS